MNDAFYQNLAIWSQILGSVAFIITLVYLFVRFVSPAVLASQERKNAELEEAERRRDAAKDVMAAAQRELEQADGDVRLIRERATSDAARERERIVADAKAEGERLVRNADGELGRARAAARDALRDELLAKALQIARDSAARIDERTNARIVGEVVQTIEREAGS
jgi:F-type H+-transporting ATPase subunit b